MSSRRGTIRLLAIVCSAAFVLAACGGGGKKSAPTQKTFPSAKQVSPGLVELNKLLDDNGVLTLDAATRLYAAYVAPLPGVTPLVLPEPAPEGIGSMAAWRLSPGGPGVTPELRAAIDGAVPADAELFDIAPGGPGKARRAQTPTREEVRAKLTAIRDRLQTLTGTRLTNPLQVRVVGSLPAGESGYSEPVGALSRTAPCRITVPRTLFNGGIPQFQTEESRTSTLAHEMWHCFQLSSNPAVMGTGPAWVIEGQAEYVGEAYVGGSGSSQASWDTWLLTPTSSLFRRSYDAIGIYALAKAQGVDPWRAMLPMLGKSNVGALEQLFGKGSAEIMKADAQSLVRAPRFGGEWETTGPGVTGARASNLLEVGVDKPATSRVDLARYSGLPIEVMSAPGDILVLEFTGGAGGAVAFPGAGTVPVEPGGRVQFCMRDKPCACPDGSKPGGGAELARITGREGVAAIGATAAGSVSINGRILSLEQACAKLVGSWEADLGAIIGAVKQTGIELPASFRCSGPVTLTFTAEGTFSEKSLGACDAGGANINVRWTGAGKYTANGFEIAFQRTSCSGALKSLCLPNGTLGYRIEGTTLFIEQRAPGGIVTKSYTRVA